MVSKGSTLVVVSGASGSIVYLKVSSSEAAECLSDAGNSRDG